MRLKSIGMRKHWYNKDAQKLYTVGKITFVTTMFDTGCMKGELRHLDFACPDLDFGNVCPTCACTYTIHIHVTIDQ